MNRKEIEELQAAKANKLLWVKAVIGLPSVAGFVYGIYSGVVPVIHGFVVFGSMIAIGLFIFFVGKDVERHL